MQLQAQNAAEPGKAQPAAAQHVAAPPTAAQPERTVLACSPCSVEPSQNAAQGAAAAVTHVLQ